MTVSNKLIEIKNTYNENDLEMVANLLAEYSQKLDSLYCELKKLQETNIDFLFFDEKSKNLDLIIITLLFLSLLLSLSSSLKPEILFIIFISYSFLVLIVNWVKSKQKNNIYYIQELTTELKFMCNKFERLVKLASQLQEHFLPEESIRSIQFDLRLLDAERVLRKVRKEISSKN